MQRLSVLLLAVMAKKEETMVSTPIKCSRTAANQCRSRNEAVSVPSHGWMHRRKTGPVSGRV